MTKSSKIVMFVMLCFSPLLSFSDTNTISSTVTGTNTLTGTTTVDKAASTANAPAIMINNSDVCRTGTTAGVQAQVVGLSAGVTIEDKNCEVLKLSRSLYSMGMKVAAVSILCQDPRVFDSMIMAGTPCPYRGTIGKEALDLWNTNTSEIPKGSNALKK